MTGPYGAGDAPLIVHIVHRFDLPGTVTTLAGVHLGLDRYDRRRVDGLWMDKDSVDLMIERLLGWDFDFSVLVSALIVLAYIFLGGLTSAIYNEVLQFFLIVAGFLPLVLLGLKDTGGWSGLQAKLSTASTNAGYPHQHERDPIARTTNAALWIE